jgi:hypothetical protein
MASYAGQHKSRGDSTASVSVGMTVALQRVLARRVGRRVIGHLARGNVDGPKGDFVYVARSLLGLVHHGYSNAGKHGRQEDALYTPKGIEITRQRTDL